MVQGMSAFVAAVNAFLGSVAGFRHEVLNVCSDGDAVIAVRDTSVDSQGFLPHSMTLSHQLVSTRERNARRSRRDGLRSPYCRSVYVIAPLRSTKPSHPAPPPRGGTRSPVLGGSSHRRQPAACLSVVSATGLIVRCRTLCASASRILILTSKGPRFTVRADQNAPRRLTNIATARANNARRVRARTTIHVAALPPLGLG